MATINLDWYAGNATRAYPLDDAATARDDAGRELPSQILVDCRVRFPLTMGRFAYIGAVTVSPSIVTALLMATANAVRPPSTATPRSMTDLPLGAVSLPRPVVSNRHYPIQPMADGVGGWLVFGRGIEEPYAGRFSSPAQSLLLPRVASAYHPLPIPSLGKLGLAQSLTGVVQLLGGTDLEVVQDVRNIEGAEVDAIIIRLVDSLNRNVYSFYTGPCGGRPESGTCDKPALQAINSVSPDCTGDLTINFANVQVIPFADGGGLALDLSLGLSDTCLGQDYLPDSSGQLPSDYENQCPPPEPPEPPGPGEPSGCMPMPYCESFDGTISPQWVVKLGSFAVEADDSPQELCGLRDASGNPIDASYCATDTTQLNAAIWDCDYSVTSMSDITVTVHLKIMPDGLPNGGIIFNYIALNPWFNQQTFLMGTIDGGSTGAGPRLGVYVYTGATSTFGEWVPLLGAQVPQVGHWYQLTLRTQLDTAVDAAPPFNNALITLTVTGITDPNYPPATGGFVYSYDFPGARFGIGSFNSHCRFSFFGVGITGEALEGCVPLPYYESFDSVVPSPWTVVFGSFNVENDDSPGEPYGLDDPSGSTPAPGRIPGLTGLPPLQRATRTVPATASQINRSYTATNQSMRNASIWNCAYDPTLDLTCTTHLKLMPGPQVNGGIIWDYKASDPEFDGRPTYNLVAIDPGINGIAIWIYRGYSIQRSIWYPFNDASGNTNMPVVGDWYELTVRTRLNVNHPVNPVMWMIGITVKGVTNPAYPTKSVDQPWDLVPVGKIGLGTVNAHTRFSFFNLEQTPTGGPP